MKFYKNIEISKEYGVSLPTVSNWIKDSLIGKKCLELVMIDNRHYITKTDSNLKLMNKYTKHGFKYKPSNARVVGEPDKNYIKYLNDKHLIEIKKDLLDKKRLDLKYVYIGGGATLWNKMYEKSSGGSSATYEAYNKMNILTIPRILDLLGKRKINVFEIGAGNGKPLIKFLHALEKENRLNSYVSIDISLEMNKIQEGNLKSEFKNLNFSSYTLDVENETFEDIVYTKHQSSPNTTNVFVMYGGTFGNFSNPEKAIMNIEKSMLAGDLLCINNPYPNIDRYKDGKYMYESPTADHYLFAARSLGIKAEPENLEFNFDLKTKTRQL